MYKRMIDQDVICTDKFLDMPFEAQALFFQLQVRTDEYGFIQSPRGIIRATGASAEALDILIENGYVIRFESGVIVLVHWNCSNTRRPDRVKPIRFPNEYSLLELDAVKAYRLRDVGTTTTYQCHTTGEPLANQTDTSGGRSISISTINKSASSISTAEASSSSIRDRQREKDAPDDDEPFLVRKLNKVPWLEGVTDKVLEYRSKLSDELISYGVDRALEYGGKTLKYLRKILDGFVTNGYTTVEQAEGDEERGQRVANSPYKPYKGLPGELVV